MTVGILSISALFVESHTFALSGQRALSWLYKLVRISDPLFLLFSSPMLTELLERKTAKVGIGVAVAVGIVVVVGAPVGGVGGVVVVVVEEVGVRVKVKLPAIAYCGDSIGPNT